MAERRTRVEQSIRLICDALWSLMEQKPFSGISVSEVCQTATVSRNTFYRRFRSLEDVLDYYLEKETSDILTQYIILEHFDKRNPSEADIKRTYNVSIHRHHIRGVFARFSAQKPEFKGENRARKRFGMRFSQVTITVPKGL